jgi:hypothetical protein
MVDNIETLMGTGESRALNVSAVWEFCAAAAHTRDTPHTARNAAIATGRPRRHVIVYPAK